MAGYRNSGDKPVGDKDIRVTTLSSRRDLTLQNSFYDSNSNSRTLESSISNSNLVTKDPNSHLDSSSKFLRNSKNSSNTIHSSGSKDLNNTSDG